jgi:hypothetical protein
MGTTPWPSALMTLMCQCRTPGTPCRRRRYPRPAVPRVDGGQIASPRCRCCRQRPSEQELPGHRSQRTSRPSRGSKSLPPSCMAPLRRRALNTGSAGLRSDGHCPHGVYIVPSPTDSNRKPHPHPRSARVNNGQCGMACYSFTEVTQPVT